MDKIEKDFVVDIYVVASVSQPRRDGSLGRSMASMGLFSCPENSCPTPEKGKILRRNRTKIVWMDVDTQITL